MGILVITTGGTIGALAHPDPKNPPRIVIMPPKGQDLVRDALKTEFAAAGARCVPFEHRDSNLIDEEYRKKLLQLVLEVPEGRILLTHGTDTFLESADYFYRHLRDNPALGTKALVMTGSMTPLANGPASDGYQNLAFALGLLNSPKAAALEGKISIVLSDFDAGGDWKPKLYDYAPGKYEKYFDPSDGRRHRLRLIDLIGPSAP